MNTRYNFVGDLETTDQLPSNPNLGDVYKIENFYYVWTGDGWLVHDESDYDYQDHINYLGKLESTDFLPKYPDLGDTYEIDTFFYSWNNKEWVINSNENSKLRSINVMQSETVVGPAGPPGDVWVPAVDTFGNLSWTKNVGVIPPTMVNIKGSKGDTGARGPQGPVGPSGPQGIIGPMGPQGVAGPQGERGFTGEQGPVGPMGLTGQRGPQGLQGVKGDTGSRGLIGQQGPRGYGIDVKIEGTTVQFKKENEVWGENPEYGSPVDIKGPKGDQGPMGPSGKTGPQGPRGITGSRGPIGQTGIQGMQGPIGPKGETGAGVKIVGEVNSMLELPPTGLIGDAYLFGELLCIWIEDTKSWKQVSGIRGPQGEKGQVGDTVQIYLGEVKTVEDYDQAGAELVWQGNNRILNLSIPRGQQGQTGPANVITATVESTLPSSQAEVVVTGEAPNQNIHFKIPVGKNGAQGITGANGKDLEYRWVNSDGNPDSVNGKFLQVRQAGGTWDVPKELGGKDGVDGIQGEKGEQGDPIKLTVSSEELLPNEELDVVVSEVINGSQNIHFKIPKAEQGEQGLPGAPGAQGPIGPAGPPGMVDYGLVYTKPEVDDMVSDLQSLTQNPIFKTGISIDTDGESGISLSGSKITGAPYNGFIHGKTSQYGSHGYVTNLDAIFNTATGIGTGWIWNSNSKNVASLSSDGRMILDGSLKAYSLDVEDYVKGRFYGDLEGDVIGNATTATKLQTPVSISMDGGVTGTAEFDGSSDIIINTELTGNIGLVDNTNKSIQPHEMLEGMYGSVDTMFFNNIPGEGYNNLTLNMNSESHEVDNTQLGFSRGAVAFRQENHNFPLEDKLDSRIIFGIQTHRVKGKNRLFCFTTNNKYPNGWSNVKYIDDTKNDVSVFYDIGTADGSLNTISGAIDSNGRVYVGPAYKYEFPLGNLNSHTTTSTAIKSTELSGKTEYHITLEEGTYIEQDKFTYDISSDISIGEKISVICEYEILTNEVPETEKLSFSMYGGQFEINKPTVGSIGKVIFENVEIKSTPSISLKNSSFELVEKQIVKLRVYYVRGVAKPFTTLKVPNGAFAVDTNWNRDTHTFILKNADRKQYESSIPLTFSQVYNSEYQRIVLPQGVSDVGVGLSGPNTHFVGATGNYVGTSVSQTVNFAISSDTANTKTVLSPEYLPEYIMIYSGKFVVEDMGLELGKEIDITTHGQTSAWGEWNRLYNDTYHPYADKLSKPVKISVVGDVTGEITTDFSKDATLNINVINDSHLHNETYYTKIESDEMNKKNFLNLGVANNLDGLYKNGLYTVEKYGGLTSPWVGESEGRIFNITKDGSEYNPTEPMGKSIVQTFINVDGRIATRNRLEDAGWSIWNYTFNDMYHPQADKLTNARNINGVPFDGTEDITITADPNPHEHSTDDITSGILSLDRGGIGVDGNTLEGYIKRDKYTNAFKAVKNISWHDIVDIPPSIGGNGSGGSGGSGTIELPNASTTTAGVVMLSIDINDTSISKAATPYLTNLLNTKHNTLQTAFVDHVAIFNTHTHDFDKININDARDVGTNMKAGVTRLYSSMGDLYNDSHGAPSQALFKQEVATIYTEFDAVAALIAELDENKADAVHTHNATTDITDGVLALKYGGTGATSFTGKYIINKDTYLSSLDKIPWADIDVDSDAFADKVHMHSWTDIYSDSIPLAETDPAIHGIVKMTQDWNSAEADITLSAFAIQKKVESFTADAAPKDHHHDDRYRRLDTKINWQDINKFTVDRAMIGDGEDFQGIVSLSDSLSLDRSDIAATASAVKQLNDKLMFVGDDFAPLYHEHDASHIVSGILDVDHGGTGTNLMLSPSGFMKFDSAGAKINTQLYIGTLDLDTSVYETFARAVHRHSFWEDLDEIPIAMSNQENQGLVKITENIDYIGADIGNVVPHISLVKTLGDQIAGFEVDAYTKSESDSKFLGKQGLFEYTDFDSATSIGILENNSLLEIMSQQNAPSETYGILQTIPSARINAQMYYDADGQLFFRAYQNGTTGAPWRQVTFGGDIGLATYENPGIFKVNNFSLMKEDDTVPTTKLVSDYIDTVLDMIDGEYAPLVHTHVGLDITTAVQRAYNFEVPETINFSGDVTVDEPVVIYGGNTWDAIITITKKASLTQDGIVQLSQDFAEKLDTKAATINSVSILYDMLTGDSDEVAYVKKSGDTMTGELAVPSISLNAAESSSIFNSGVSLTLNNGNGQINGANIYHENFRPLPEDIGAEPAITILPITKGGTGTGAFSSKYILNGPTALTSADNIPWVDIVNVPISSTTEYGIIKVGYEALDAAPGNHRHNNVTTIADGFMSYQDKVKIDGIQAGSEVNQNAFSTIKVNSTSVSATTKMDTFQFIAGSNIELTNVGKVMTIKNTYVHPTTDGNKHVPANGTTNNGKFLMSSSLAGVYSWSDLPTASTGKAGIVKLNNTLTSTSVLEAPTSNALNMLYKMITTDDPTVAYVKKTGDTMTGNLTLPKLILSQSASSIVNASGVNIVETSGNNTFFGGASGGTTIISSVNPMTRVLGNTYTLFHTGKLPDVNTETAGVALVSKGGTGTASFENKYIIKSTETTLTSIAKIPWGDVDVEVDEDGNIVPPGTGGSGTGGFVPAEHTHPWADIQPETIPKASTVLGTEGIVALYDGATSSSITVAATANSVKMANDNASSRVSKSGDVMTGSLTATDLISGGKVEGKTFEFGPARIVFNTVDQSIDFIID